MTSLSPVKAAIAAIDNTFQDASRAIAHLPTVEDRVTVRVLLIDDQPIVAESVRRLLASESDIQLHYCRDAQQAIPMASEIMPTVILQDLVMPDADGLMLVKFLRANPATSTIPVIMLSTRDESVVKAEAFAAGANDYLVKIPDPIEFVARLRYHSTAYANLKKRHEIERISLINKELEIRVAERTAELESTLVQLKQTQLKMIQEEKMSGLSQLVAGVCHELNNPVSFIMGNLAPAQEYCEALFNIVSLYQQAYPTPPEHIQSALDEADLEFLEQDFDKLLTSLQNGGSRISNIVDSLRTFSRLGEEAVKSVDIHDGIEHSLRLLSEQLKSINVIKDYTVDFPVECLPGQLNQVFIQLLSNAVDALTREQDDSTVVQQTVQDPTIRIQTRALENGQILIQVSNNGPSISQENINRIFEPFFTTKPIGQGTGLGLSLSYQIIAEQHGGSLECMSTPGASTDFMIKIPTQQMG